jgi:multimeric flavodoxin WrbA
LEEQLKILAIVGSPRPKGNTNYLVDLALKEAAKKGAQTEKIILSQFNVNPCIGHDNCASFDSCLQKDDADWILNKFRKAEGVILACPVYYYNVPAQMKAFIDRNYFIYKHEQKYGIKVVGIIVVAEQMGIEDTLHTLRQFTDEFNVAKDKVLIVSGYANKTGDAQKNNSLAADAKQLGKQMVETLS